MSTHLGDANLYTDKQISKIENMKDKKPSTIRPFINIKILDHEFPAFLDTGSSLSVVGDAVIKIIHERGIKCRPVSQEIQFLKGTCTATRSVSVKIDFGEGIRRQNLILMPGSIETVLLGRDFLGPNMIGVNIGLGGWTCGINSKIISFIPGPKRFLLNSEEIPTTLNCCPFESKSEPNGKDHENHELEEVMVINQFSCPAEALANWDYEPDVQEDLETIPEVPLSRLPPSPFENFEELKAPAYLTESQRSQLDEVIQNFSPIFTKSPGLCKLYEHTIDTGDHKPITTTLRHMNPAKRKIFDENFFELLKYDIIEKSNSPWAANGFVVPKKGGGHRVVIDYKPINKVTIPDVYPITRMDDMLAILGPCCYFSTFDLSKGFHQILMSPKDKIKTAFLSHHGLWQFKRLPMGLRNSPATFMRCLDQVLGDLKWKICAIYFNDIVIFSRTFEEHLMHIRLVLQKLKDAGLTIHPGKVQLCRKKFKFLGFIIEPGKCRPNPEKVDCLRNYPAPKDVKQVQRFLGLVGFYRRFIPDFAKHAKPLTQLTKKENKFNWTSEVQKSFDYMKSTLTEITEVYLPDLNGPFIIQADAADKTIGSILLQEKDGIRHPIWFASRSLKPAEVNYSTSEKECLAVLWAIEKFRGFIELSHFVVETDHQALKWLQNIKEPSGRLARWFLTLQMYNFEVRYRPGNSTHMKGADALSRIPQTLFMENSNGITRSCMIKAQKEDLVLNAIIIYTQDNNPLENSRLKKLAERCYIASDGLLFRYVGPRGKSWEEESKYWRVWIPQSLKFKVIEMFHSNLISGHLGIRKTFGRLEMRVYWKNLRKDIAHFVNRCLVCQMSNNSRLPPVPANSSFISESPWEIITIDLMGPYPKGFKGHTYILVVVDMLTKYVELCPLRSITSKVILDNLWKLFGRWGLPRVILSDNGRQFCSNVYTEWCESLGIKPFYISPYHPQSNLTERYIQTIKGMIVSTISKCKDWDRFLPELTFALITAVNDSTHFTPAYLNTGREFRTPFDNQMSLNLCSSSNRDIIDLGRKINIILQVARDNITSSQETSLSYYNLKTKAREFKVGDKVWLKTHFLSDASKGFSAKLAPKREGPYEVTKIITKNIYDLAFILTGQKVYKVHINELSPFLELDQDVSPSCETTQPLSAEISESPNSSAKPTVFLPSNVSVSGDVLTQPLVPKDA